MVDDDSEAAFDDKDGLLPKSHPESRNSCPQCVTSYKTPRYATFINGLLIGLSIGIVILVFGRHLNFKDPSLELYCTDTLKRLISLYANNLLAPANEAVEYMQHTFGTHFFTSSLYMGFPDDEIDKRWEDLYNCKTF